MFPCKVGSAWEIFAPAKLNLYLNVLGTRPDGFHNLETLLVPVQVYDTLRWIPSEPKAGASLQVCTLLPEHESRHLGDSNDNLILQAARHLAHSAGIEPTGIFELTKRIPIQAGMGGGSSDAAAALLLANSAWNIGYSRQRLCELAAKLGSDVPFFISSSPAICRGRGELVEPIIGMPNLHFVIVKPPLGLSTTTVFSRLKPATHPEEHGGKLGKLISLLRQGAIAQAGKHMHNALETAARELSPSILRLRQALAESGACAELMTGSGSALFAVMRSAAEARKTAQLLSSRNLGTVLATSSC